MLLKQQNKISLTQYNTKTKVNTNIIMPDEFNIIQCIKYSGLWIKSEYLIQNDGIILSGVYEYVCNYYNIIIIYWREYRLNESRSHGSMQYECFIYFTY